MHGTRDRELRDGRGRPDRRHRRPLRRPHHRQAVRVRAAGEVHPHRHRPGRDLQERARAHPDRGRREAHPGPARERVPRARPRPGAARRLVGADRALARAAPAALRRLGATPRSSRSTSSRRSTRRPAGDCILSSDVGQHQMWAAQYFHFTKPRRWINSGGLGTMGFGLPAAIGAAVAVPGRADGAADRRRLVPDEHPGARHRAPVRHPGQVRDHGQRLPGHGPPVAGAVLGPPLLERRHGPVAGLGQARRGLRGDGRAADRQDDAGRRPAGRAGHARPGHRRRQGHARGEHVPDDRARAPPRAKWWAERWASRRPRRSCSLEELEASAACGRAASTSSRSWSRTSRAC